ncbi:Bax inhibitor-1 family protein [Intestinibacter bartlettii]|uniref:Bax inhibitor-1 family protein n=1 Tax=Intestinibacter bartlettii TaxID=261299 RepID=A0ABS6DU98_9FIRM|nr:Bax inhibitor-1 family protein [Intestinibacter bartlettii]MBU5335406.1 Bax inhibitor-1 family protein [Intestinibacter bartlettii]
MFCRNCGTELESNHKFCGECGQRQDFNNDVDLSGVNNFNGSIAMDYNGGSVLKANYLEIFKTFFIGMAFVALGTIFALYCLPYSIIEIIDKLFLVFIVVSTFVLKKNIFKTKMSLNIYSFVLGIIISVTLFYYIGSLGGSIFMSCVMGVALIFGVAYYYALNSDAEDIFSMGPMLYKCMWALVAFEILNIFLFRFGLFDMVLSTAAILIYSTYTVYTMKVMQVQCESEILDEESIVIISLSLITSFLNLLLHLLRIVAAAKRD